MALHDPAPRRTELDNGAVMLSRPVSESWGVSLGILVRRGSRDEQPEWGGICHLLEHMVFKGTARRSALDIARELEDLGAQLDAYTTKEYTGYTLRVLGEQLVPSLDIVADMLLHSEFPPDQLALERQVVVEEILSCEDNPEDFVHEALEARLLEGHPLSRPILGTRDSLARIGPGQLHSHAQDAHRGGNVLIGLAGEVDESVERQVAAAFAFPAGHSRTLAAQAADPRPGLWNHPRDGLGQQYVELATPALAADHPDRYALALLASALGGGMSSRLFQRVREEEGLAYSIYSGAESYRDTGSLETSFSASPEHCQRALDVVAEEYDRLRREGLSARELELNRNQLRSGVLLAQEGSLNQVGRMLRDELVHGRHVPLAETLSAIEAITATDVQRLASGLLDPGRQTVVAHGPVEGLRFAGVAAA